MRSIQVTKYCCDHCSKTSLAAWAMRKHEQWCFFNPDRKCPECGSTGITGFRSANVENPVKAREGDCPVCLKALCARVNKSADSMADFLTYTKEQYQTDLQDYRECHPRKVNPWYSNP